MAALKVTLLSPSSSTIYGKSHSLVDKWVRRISSNTSSTTNSIVRVRVLMSTERRTKGFPTTIGKSAVRSSFRWRGGWRLKSYPHILGASDEGLAKNLRSYSQNSSSSGAIGSSSSTVTEVNSENKDDLNSSQFEQPEKKEKELEEEEESEKLLTLPTILTIARVAAVPLLISTFYMTDSWATTVTTSIFVAAAITDWLDGYLARKMQLGTAFGAFLDPVADKLMVAATLVLLCTRPLEVAMFGEMPWLLPIPSIAIIGREITMSAVREWAASQNGKVLEAVAVNNLGKWKTATQMTALTVLLATRDSSLPSSGSLVASGVALLYVSAGLAVWSLFVYMKNIWRVLLKK